ncbi:DUF4870 domain-containing protein [Chloroflexota bacterium]
MGKSSTGLEENTAGILCYVLGWVSGIVFVILEKESNLVKFHAIQSVIVFGALSLAGALFGWIPILGFIIRIAVGILAFVLWIVLIVKASQGERYKVKWAGDYAEKWAS